MESPSASIVVRAYNERDHIGRLLYGIDQQTYDGDVEVVVVDSGSTDGTLDVIEQHGVDEVVYIDPDEFSFGRSLNYGCEAASGEFCVFISAHAYPRRVDWLEQLLEKFDDGVALVYGKQRGNDVTKYPEHRIFRRWYPDEDIERQESAFCNNANAAIRRDLWTEYPYDETLTGLEDLEWAKRVRADGWDVSYAADATVIHVHDETPGEVRNRYRREALAHRSIDPSREFRFLDFLRLLLVNVTRDYVAAAKDGALPGAILEIPMFRLMQFWGTYEGFNWAAPLTDDVRRRFFYPNQPRVGRDDATPPDDVTIDYADRTGHDE